MAPVKSVSPAPVTASWVPLISIAYPLPEKPRTAPAFVDSVVKVPPFDHCVPVNVLVVPEMFVPLRVIVALGLLAIWFEKNPPLVLKRLTVPVLFT